MEIKDLQKEVHEMAKQHGWWYEKRHPGELLMLVVSEVAEAFEDYRHNRELNVVHYVSDVRNQAKPEGIPVELADIIIRVLDIAEAWGIDMEEVLRIKIDYNKKRPYRHGNLRA